MSDCEACKQAKDNPNSGLYHASCQECFKRALRSAASKEDLEVHESAVAIRRMSQPMQAHAYETLARNKGQDYANRVRAANGLTRKLLDQNGMTYSQIRGKD